MSAPMSAPVSAPADARTFVHALAERGYDLFTGVPCSILKGVIATLETQERVPYLPVSREDVAFGIAGGATLGGKRPVVLMQNSGLGVSINALISLQQIYELPCLLVITWRGYEGVDAPEHIVMGPVMPQVLDTFQVPFKTLEAETTPAQFEEVLDWAGEALAKTRRPVALLVRKGAFK